APSSPRGPWPATPASRNSGRDRRAAAPRSRRRGYRASLDVVDRDQRRPDRPALTQQNVVGPHGPAGRDGLDDHLAVAQRLPDRLVEAYDIVAEADQQNIDLVGGVEYRLQILAGDLRRRAYVPGMHAGRQAEQRAAMTHVGKAEAAIAIAVDQRLVRVEALPRLGHRTTRPRRRRRASESSRSCCRPPLRCAP